MSSWRRYIATVNEGTTSRTFVHGPTLEKISDQFSEVCAVGTDFEEIFIVFAVSEVKRSGRCYSVPKTTRGMNLVYRI